MKLYLLTIIFSLMGQSFSLASGLPAVREYRFDNQSAVKVSQATEGKLQLSYVKQMGASNGEKGQLLLISDQIKLIPNALPMMGKGALLVESIGIVSLIDQQGEIYPTGIDPVEMKSWLGTVVPYGSENYFVYSIQTPEDRYLTFVACVRDGRTVYLGTQPVKPEKFFYTARSGSIRFANLNFELEGFNTRPPVLASSSTASLAMKVIDPKQNDQAANLGKGNQAGSKNGQKSSQKKADNKSNQSKTSGPGISALYRALDLQTEIAQQLKAKVFGQDQLVDRFAFHAAHRPQSGKPTVLVVTGPSGVGKTKISELYASLLFPGENHFLVVDGTEFMSAIGQGSIEHHKLVGAPSGQQGQQKGALTEWLKKNKGSGVLVINEADKMHVDIWKRLMELMDRGVITDGDGNKIQAGELHIILTSNRGATQMFPPTVGAWSQSEISARTAGLTSDKVKAFYMSDTTGDKGKSLPREIINRVTEWLCAAPITKETAVQIATAAVATEAKEILEKYSLQVTVTPSAIEMLALTGFKSTDDGRQIERQISRYMKASLLVAAEQRTLVDHDQLKIDLAKSRGQPTALAVTWSMGSAVVPGPKGGDRNPLLDSELVERLRKIGEVLKKRVIGQDEAIKSIVEAVISHKGKANKKKPVSLFVVGSTGIGKTELGRGVAEALLGSPERVAIITLGNIMTESNYNKVFGSDPGYSGSDVVREFERALQNNPDGGVLIFDEASNMGGTDRALKEALFKKLYELTEEGKWVSPINGQEYDLSKFVFLFTGNDGEKIVQGMSSDDLRIAAWRENKSRDQVRQLLLAAGIPEAFLGRMADMILMKPLVRAESDLLVKKLLAANVAEFEKQFEGLKISYDEGFERQVADSFFASDRGGRSVRAVLDDRFSALIVIGLVNSGLDLSDLRLVDLKLTLSDNAGSKPYSTRWTPEHDVELKMELSHQGFQIHTQSINLTEYANAPVQMGSERARAVAFHEAGHAAINDPDITDEEVDMITIRGGRDKELKYLGYARYKKAKSESKPLTRANVVLRMARLYAGLEAQRLAGFPMDAGWSNDLKKIRGLAEHGLLTYGLDESFNMIRLKPDGTPDLSPAELRLFNLKSLEMMAEAKKLATDGLKAKWPLVRAVTAELLKTGQIDGKRFEEIKKELLNGQRQFKLFEQSKPSGPIRSCTDLLGGSI